jgi:hypothetical protein
MTPSVTADSQFRRGSLQGISVQTPLGEKAFVVRRISRRKIPG